MVNNWPQSNLCFCPRKYFNTKDLPLKQIHKKCKFTLIHILHLRGTCPLSGPQACLLLSHFSISFLSFSFIPLSLFCLAARDSARSCFILSISSWSVSSPLCKCVIYKLFHVFLYFCSSVFFFLPHCGPNVCPKSGWNFSFSSKWRMAWNYRGRAC